MFSGVLQRRTPGFFSSRNTQYHRHRKDVAETRVPEMVDPLAESGVDRSEVRIASFNKTRGDAASITAHLNELFPYSSRRIEPALHKQSFEGDALVPRPPTTRASRREDAEGNSRRLYKAQSSSASHTLRKPTRPRPQTAQPGFKSIRSQKPLEGYNPIELSTHRDPAYPAPPAGPPERALRPGHINHGAPCVTDHDWIKPGLPI